MQAANPFAVDHTQLTSSAALHGGAFGFCVRVGAATGYNLFTLRAIEFTTKRQSTDAETANDTWHL
jgi:hypothetical protein